jgi:hypothetical protein
MRVLFFTSLVCAFGSFGQSVFQNVCIQNYKKRLTAYGQCEPSVAIHPKNQNIIAAGTILDSYYFSTDGGYTWEVEKLKCKYGVYGDPTLLFDTNGRIYYFHLSNYRKTSWLDRIVCQSSDNVREKFNNGTSPKPNGSKVQDKQWVALNTLNNELYMTWTQFDKYNSHTPTDSSIIVFSKSSDQGETWSNPMRISKHAGDCLDSDNTVEGAVPAVGPHGEIYVVWSGPHGLVFQCSVDGGNTWLKEEQVIQKHVGGWDLSIPGMMRANGLPILTCDVSNGPNRGTLYLNWCDQRNGVNNTDVWLSSSKDHGKTWSELKKVNQDSTNTHQFFTWSTIDQQTGNLYVVYYDRRNYTDNQTDVFLSASFDGGLSFHDVCISESPFVPNEKVFFGDYLNISAVNGTIRPIWSRMDVRKITLWTALISESQLLKSIGK